MSSTAHLDRKELKRPDVFVASGQKFLKIIETNRKTLGVLILAAALVTTAYFMTKNYMYTKSLEEAGKLYTIESSFSASYDKLKPEEKTAEEKTSSSNTPN